jgi:serine/threonine protein kinase
VFKAFDRELKRTVAIKMILSGTLAALEALQRFRSETEAIGRLNHPNLVRIYETGHVDGRPYAVMEYIEGGTLAEHLDDRPFGPDEAARIVAELAEGMESAHQKGVLHRDR